MTQLNEAQFTPVGKRLDQSGKIARPTTTYMQDAWRRLRANKIAMASIVLLVVVLLFAVIGPRLSQFTSSQQDPTSINNAPNATHLFGTDSMGRDLFVRCWEGARVSLFIAFVAAVINLLIGVLYGGISGFLGGRTDLIMMRFVEIVTTVPDLLWVILLMVILGTAFGYSFYCAQYWGVSMSEAAHLIQQSSAIIDAMGQDIMSSLMLWGVSVVFSMIRGRKKK